jgi:hypothetical protein
MADAKTPMQRQREERRALGWRDVNIWLTPEGQQRVARLSEPGESLSTLLDRALAALDILHSRKETRSETRDIPSETVHREDLQSIIASEVARYFTSDTTWKVIAKNSGSEQDKAVRWERWREAPSLGAA